MKINKYLKWERGNLLPKFSRRKYNVQKRRPVTKLARLIISFGAQLSPYSYYGMSERIRVRDSNAVLIDFDCPYTNRTMVGSRYLLDMRRERLPSMLSMGNFSNPNTCPRTQLCENCI